MSPEVETIARQIADAVVAERSRLDELGPYRVLDEDWARVEGMEAAVAIVLGRPEDTQLAKAFIADTPEWRALL